jgi:hypothetical protein
MRPALVVPATHVVTRISVDRDARRDVLPDHEILGSDAVAAQSKDWRNLLVDK